MRRVTAACALALSCLPACGAQSPQSPTPSSPTPIWQDEFDTPGLPNAGRWDHEVGLIRNNERQSYTRDRSANARVEDGMLIIEAQRERFQGADYTSASLTSRSSWTYGRIEVRAKLPKGRGTWPAIWMLGTQHPRRGLAHLRRDRHHGTRRVRSRTHPREHPHEGVQPRPGHEQGKQPARSQRRTTSSTSTRRSGPPRRSRSSSTVSATSPSPGNRAGTRCGRSTSRNTSSSISRSVGTGAVSKASTTPPSRRGS